MGDGLPQYNLEDVKGVDTSTLAQNDAMTQRASQTPEQFTGQINQNVKEQSNLMGDKTQSDPESDALSARASQMYGSQVNSMMRQAKMAGVDRQNQVQTQNVNAQAAQYANAQQRAQMNYQQISFQRSAAIEQENYKRQLYGQLFGGIGAVGGVAAAGIAKMKTPTEAGMQADLKELDDTSWYQ